MLRYSNKLATSGLQFSFKSVHSTTMCSLTTKEVVKYYWNRHSRVYAAFIDALKAFDRIRYDCLFGILIKRGLPPIIIRTIIDVYERLESRAMWDNEYGDYFKCINVVLQGRVVSPLMFNIYMDKLIKELLSAGIGCYVGDDYFGCVSYADDMKLLCPSIKGLQQMIEICERFGEKI